MSDQPKPTPNNSRPVIDAAIEMLERRRELGQQRYGTPLQTGNGRDFGRDADEEMADWMIYWAGYRIEHAERIRGLLMTVGKIATERDTLRAALREAVEVWSRSAEDQEEYDVIARLKPLLEGEGA